MVLIYVFVEHRPVSFHFTKASSAAFTSDLSRALGLLLGGEPGYRNFTSSFGKMEKHPSGGGKSNKHLLDDSTSGKQKS